MKNTERLYGRIQDERNELEQILLAKNNTRGTLHRTATALARKYPKADLQALLDHIDDGIDDMMHDLIEPHREAIRDADREIGDIEYADNRIASRPSW